MNDKPSIRNESILLLGLCRLEFGVELKIMLQALAEEPKDWNYFAGMANAHGVASLVFHNLEILGFVHLLPVDVYNFLRNASLVSLTRNTGNMRNTAEALVMLNRANVKTVLLKGMALELTVYGNRGLRQMTDADVLVSREDALKAFGVLKKNGFVPLPVKSVFHRLIPLYTGKHLPSLIKNDYSIEIHHELFGTDKSALTRMLYDTATEAEAGGEKAFIPEPQIFFLYLLKHLRSHELNNESQLRLYADLVVLLERYRGEIINTELLVNANQAGLSHELAGKLELLRDLWGVSFPGWLDEFIDKWFDPASMNRFVAFLGSPKDNPVPVRSSSYRDVIKEIPGFHRKLIYVLGDLFPTISFMKKRYACRSGWKALLYYPHRFGKLLWL